MVTGDEMAWADFFREHAAMERALVRLIAPALREADADDTLQLARKRLSRWVTKGSDSSKNPGKARDATHLRRTYSRIIRCSILSFLRNLKRQAAAADPLKDKDVPDESPSPAPLPEHLEAILPFMPKCLAKLEAHEREILRLYYHEDVQFVQIASQLHLSDGGVRSIHFKALKKLRACLERCRGSTRPL
jgi:RNA polymerase sigma factor (sigma-70 family)